MPKTNKLTSNTHPIIVAIPIVLSAVALLVAMIALLSIPQIPSGVQPPSQPPAATPPHLQAVVECAGDGDWPMGDLGCCTGLKVDAGACDNGVCLPGPRTPCINCGDGVCADWEDECTCPMDCGDCEPECGGIRGIDCPNGYFCTNITSGDDLFEEVGYCRKINVERLGACLQNRSIGIVCSTTYDCARQRQLLGNLFGYLKVEYDDNLTKCSNYGDSCKFYNDTEMVVWVLPDNAPFPSYEPYAIYPQFDKPTYTGARSMERIAKLAMCEEEL